MLYILTDESNLVFCHEVILSNPLALYKHLYMLFVAPGSLAP